MALVIFYRQIILVNSKLRNVIFNDSGCCDNNCIPVVISGMFQIMIPKISGNRLIN